MPDSNFFSSVSFNCDVSDAKYWGFFSICSLLLRLRELFKIERALEPWDEVENSEILDWIEEKEKKWHSLEQADLKAISIGNKIYSPFDTSAINKQITSLNFVYGAGYALYMKPSFFVGILERVERVQGFKVYYVGREIVRDLFSSSGMSLNGDIFIRLTDIKFRLWEDIKIWNSRESRLTSLFLPTQRGQTELFSHEFSKLVDKFAKIVLYHEIAEHLEKPDIWNQLLSECNSSKSEKLIRVITDLVADLSDHGPIKKGTSERDSAMLALYMQSLDPYQRKIMGKAISSFEQALVSENWETIEKLRQSELKKWKSHLERIIDIYRTNGFQQIKAWTDKFLSGGFI